MTCPICLEKYSKVTRAEIMCPFCPWTACASCVQRYLLETTQDAHCMSCRKGWSREVLVNNFTSKFVSRTYKERREDLLFEREKSLMPATQPYVECEMRIRALDREIHAIKTKYGNACEKYNMLARRDVGDIMQETGMTSQLDARIERERQAVEQRKICDALVTDIRHREWIQDVLKEHMNGATIEREKRQFVRACPYQDCRGFLSTVWKCGVCSMWTCPECHEVKGPEKDAEHTCNPDNVATARMLERDSRNCPTCAALIFKISGCDQMFCTQCHTAFSWRTGKVEKGVIHNPHYFETQRRLGLVPRAHGDIPCGGFPDWHDVSKKIPSNIQDMRPIIRNAYQLFGHVYFHNIPRYRTVEREENRDLRIALMMKDISEDVFKKKIQQREKARQRKTDIRQVLEMFTAVLNDLFQMFVTPEGNVATLFHSLCELRVHTDETLLKISRRWNNCAVPRINEIYVLR
jgi:hypothetical protein